MTKLRQITAEELAWVAAQALVGDPSLTRLRSVLKRAGLAPVELALTDKGEGLEFRLRRSAGLQELDREQMLRLLIGVMRRAGFDVGFSEVAIINMNASVVDGFTYTAPLSQLFHLGPPEIAP